MSSVNLSGVDLNLLHVVATVLEERSATRAAARLHVTQSAVSNALRRARELFGDPLVLREARGLSPTPRGAALLPELRGWLEQARRLITDTPRFDPGSSRRTFTVACSDAVAIALLSSIVRRLARAAPNARLRLVTLDRMIADDALTRGEIDLLVGIPPVLPDDHFAELVYRDPMQCIVRKGHPRVRDRLTLAAYASLPHVDVALFGTPDDRVDQALARHGRTRLVAVALPHFSSLPLAVVASDAVATVSRRLARVFAAQMPLRVLDPPVALEPLEVRQIWHRRAATDPAVTFLRAVIRDAARDG